MWWLSPPQQFPTDINIALLRQFTQIHIKQGAHRQRLGFFKLNKAKTMILHAGQLKLLLYAKNDPFSNQNVPIYLTHNIRPLGCNLYADSLLVCNSDESFHNHQGLNTTMLGNYGSSLNKHSTPQVKFVSTQRK